MKLRLCFPDYERIQTLNKNKEYYFTIFTIYKNIYCRITYNENFCGKFKADLMCGGYCDMYKPYQLNYWYNNTKEDYNRMCSKIELLYNEIANNILHSNDEMDWSKVYE